MQQLPSGDSRLRQRHALLKLECQRLEARALAAEQALIDMQGSTIWRATAPLRWALITLRKIPRRLFSELSVTPFGQRMLARLPRFSPTARPAGVDKERLRAEAEGRLDEFLASDQRLRLPADEAPKVSIVLVFFNQAALSLDCLRSIVACCDVPAEILIVDNASSDRTDELLDRLDGARLIQNSDNRGFVEAVNQAAAIARGEHLLLLNNDAELMPGAISAAIDCLASDAQIGAVGGRIILRDGRLQEAGSIIWSDGSCLGYGRGLPADQPEFMFRRDVDYCSGAFLLTPRKLFEQLGGFDLAYAPAYYEESDYCTRLRRAGYRVVYEPSAVIRHFEFASSGGMSGATELQRAHRKLFVERHGEFLAGQQAPDPACVLAARSASRRPRVLLIDDRVPHVQLGSGYPRCHDLVRSLVDLGFEVTLYPLTFPDDDWAQTYRTLPREVEVMLGHGILGLTAFIQQRSDHYDQVIISRPHNMRLLRNALGGDLAAFGRSRLIYDAEAVIAPREAARLRLIGEPLDQTEAEALLREELDLASGVDRIITVSEAEALLYRRAGHRQVDVLGHAIAPSPTRPGFSERQGFLFIGALRDDVSPNVDSLLWFVEAILPRLVEQLGEECRLYVVGDPSAPALDAIEHEQVHFLGALNSLELPLSACRVMIAPTRFAAGIPHKVHAAAASGLPVVATDLLAVQLGWQHGRELLTADDEQAFAQACLRLYQDPELWQAVREAGLAAIERDCSPRAFRDRVGAIFRD